jgi:Spx/MgsR family transcriptional regulator
MGITLHGIPNCDTVKKARAALAAAGVEHRFRDFKKDPPGARELAAWADATGWEVLLNRRGTTFRGIAEDDKANIDEAKALRLMAAHPSLIKRPVIEGPSGITAGWNEDIQARVAG